MLYNIIMYACSGEGSALLCIHLTIVSMHFHNLGLADLHVFFACIYKFMLLELQQNFSELLHKLPVHTYTKFVTQ